MTRGYFNTPSPTRRLALTYMEAAARNPSIPKAKVRQANGMMAFPDWAALQSLRDMGYIRVSNNAYIATQQGLTALDAHRKATA